MRAYSNSSTTPSPCGRLDGLEHLEAVLLVVTGRTQAALGLERRDTGEVAIELGREEADPPHLTLGDDIDPGVLLVAHGDVDRVVLELADVPRAQLAAFGRGHGQVEPAGMGV